MKLTPLVFSLSLVFSPLGHAEINNTLSVEPGVYESQSLQELQDVTLQKRNTATSEENTLRIDLIYDEAVELGISNGYAQTMDLFIEVIESKSALFDMLLPFESLSNIAGDLNATEARFIRPGIVDKTTNSAAVTSRIDLTMIELKNQSYYLREQPQPVLRPPSWTDYIYDSNKIKVHSISKELLPRTEEEKEAYLDGLDEGWAMGH